MVPVGAQGSEEPWGLIVHSGSHWCAYRRVSDDSWVNVNSMLKQPKLVCESVIKRRIAKGFVDTEKGNLLFAIVGNVPSFPQEEGPCVHKLKAL